MESLTRRRTQPRILFVLLLLTAFNLLVAVRSTAVSHNIIYISRKLLQRSPVPPTPRGNRFQTPGPCTNLPRRPPNTPSCPPL
ncbi:hypothetical protein MKW98_017209 [Papaver atlanticum]|uniref:Uncharacterized protein n=1 Tax=Papaver atlanticum TaxID=357466 RepID=A0AAD4SC40_9MAGN|nr:hypothetical protein MKW98_017209 [Papaver atlanticum]